MSLYKSLFKQTAIYGLATVLPRMISFLLNPLYVKVLPNNEFADVSIVFAYLVFFNVVLSYGMETAFFRFYKSEKDKNKVVTTTMISIFWSSILFLIIALIYRNWIANYLKINVNYVTYTVWTLVFDALVIVPFSKFRAEGKPLQYAIIKIGNVMVNMGLNLFFLLLLPVLATANKDGFWNSIYLEKFEVGYIFLSGLISSMLTFVVLIPNYLNQKWVFDVFLWKKMMQYGLPILVAGIGFAINEHFDKILLERMHVSKSEIGAYAACYKLGMFMVLFRTAYTLGIEPFFFSHSDADNAPETYATITKYFVIFGSLILLFVIVFADLFKLVLLNNHTYWGAMKVVPLIILANFFLGIYYNLSVWYKLIDKTYIGAVISVIGAVITLLFNYLLIPTMSYYGSAIATIMAYGTMMSVSYYLGNKYYPIPYDTNKIFGYLGISIVFSGVSFYCFRGNYLVGIGFIVLFFGFIYYNEKAVLLSVLKKKNRTS